MSKFTPLLLSLGVVLLSCSVKKNNQDQGRQIKSNIISNRPTNIQNVLVIIKLRSPSLFAASQWKEGNLIIDQEQKELLLTEEKNIRQELANLSRDIRILYTYKFTLNAVAAVIPLALVEKLSSLPGVASYSRPGHFYLPKSQSTQHKNTYDLSSTTVDFIGASKVHQELGILGQGIKVGIVDTGIDYTHAMLGGHGNKEEFEKLDPALPSESFPNKKVVGGIDLVGSAYDSSSALNAHQIPIPDLNPIDEGGHGSHVAGTVAGIGDGVLSYNGVAPQASLYAIKVFGKNGSTSDAVVIAGLEYASDPNGDLDPSDRLDIVNLSLGGDYGKPYIMYTEAVRNLVKGGIVFVAAAGNAGHVPFIVGSPSTAQEGISVAASIDDMKHNWNFQAVSFQGEGFPESLIVEKIESSITKKTADAEITEGKLVYVGEAASDFTETQKNALRGNIALIDRGTVTFYEKLNRAYQAGAIGVVVANNDGSPPFEMGGENQVDLLGIMVSREIGNILKDQLRKNDVFINFKIDHSFKRPELIDTITSFSSRGPRALDALIKPEITAPGMQIISAEMGSGQNTVAFSGTSMASPHMAGVMALLKEKFPTLSAEELKSIALNKTVEIKDSNRSLYPVAMQGTGRVQTYQAANAKEIVSPATISLGKTNLVGYKTIRKTIHIKNLLNRPQVYTIEKSTSPNVNISLPATITVGPLQTNSFDVQFTLRNSKQKEVVQEFEGFIKILDENRESVARVPFLAIARILSDIAAADFKIHASSELDADGAEVELTLINNSSNEGVALPFNFLGSDQKKVHQGQLNEVYSRYCDLENAGHRVIKGEDGDIFQIAVKLHTPIGNWQECLISVQIDSNQDGKAEQEFVGLYYDGLEGLSTAVPRGLYSLLLDAEKARQIRKKYELAQIQSATGTSERPNYVESILEMKDMISYTHSSIAIIQVSTKALARNREGGLNIKIGVLNEETETLEGDDFLGEIENQWRAINLHSADQGYQNLPENIVILGNSSKKISLTKGGGSEDLVIYFPYNLPSHLESTRKDRQSQLLKYTF